MVNALWITLIGMGLVFVAILLLWGLMALLVRLTSEKKPAFAEQPAAGEQPMAAENDSAQVTADRKRRAAAAAVTVALAMQQKSARPLPKAAGSSAWQTAHRAGQLRQGERPTRKQGVR